LPAKRSGEPPGTGAQNRLTSFNTDAMQALLSRYAGDDAEHFTSLQVQGRHRHDSALRNDSVHDEGRRSEET
jgi:hypothetical protein